MQHLEHTIKTAWGVRHLRYAFWYVMMMIALLVADLMGHWGCPSVEYAYFLDDILAGKR